ncbi:hypothetical protein ACRS81_02265 [Stutzerimonas stutzeri]|uniref:hypothetical protein n=1 Tax=Stutzerimonas stutzeri TaxID=316 RepID=UPI003EE39F0A
MGAAIDYLRQRGLTARANGHRIIVSPASKLTADVRQYVKAHRLDLLAELAANDGETRRSVWDVFVPGHGIRRSVGQPRTHAEALAGARLIWPDAEVMQ